MGAGNIHLLIVDDCQPMRMLVRSMLAAGGVRSIYEADTAEHAFAMLHGPINIVLLDWQMQPVDGIAFTRALRRDPKCPKPYLPVLMMTAHTEASRVAAARDAGVTGFVKKPVSAQSLFARIAMALTDERLFVRCENFIGPDRRRTSIINYKGPYRRETDLAEDTFDIDDARCA